MASKARHMPRDASCAGAELWPQTRERRAFLVRTPWHDCGKSRSVETMAYPPEPADMTDRPPECTVANMRTRFLPVSHDARTFLNRPACPRAVAAPGRCAARPGATPATTRGLGGVQPSCAEKAKVPYGWKVVATGLPSLNSEYAKSRTSLKRPVALKNSLVSIMPRRVTGTPFCSA